jgi:alpha-D-xyloside xylohydrolase
MKFTEGVWYGKEDVDITSAVEVAKLSIDPLERPYYPSLSKALPALSESASSNSSLETSTLRALFHTRQVKSRGDTLNKPTLTTTISSPAPGIIKVETSHFTSQRAQKEPRVRLFPGGGEAKDDRPSKVVFNHQEGDEISTQPESISLYSGNNESHVTLDLSPGDFGIQFYGKDQGSCSLSSKPPRPLTSLRPASLSWILHKSASPQSAVRENAVTTISDPYYRSAPSRRQSYMSASLTLAVGENVYGLGERFGPFIKNGQVIEVSQEDGGTSSSAGESRPSSLFASHQKADTSSFGRLLTSLQEHPILHDQPRLRCLLRSHRPRLS